MKSKTFTEMETNLFNYNLAEIQISYSTQVKASDRPKITTSLEAYEIFKNIFPRETIELKESFYALFLNRANRILGYLKVSEGGISGTVADPRLIFATALKVNASSIVIAHNHPSGNTEPSAADKNLTKQIVEGGKLLEITVLDHLILTADWYYSFADMGMI